MGVSIKNYILTLKLDSSLILLKDKNYSVEEISSIVGFESYNTFYKMFCKRFSETPKQYQSNPFETRH
jgi:transcriptional regulator GlxA family with amidase domain